MFRRTGSAGFAASGNWTPRHIPAVNGLRGLAIIAVVYCHIVTGLWSPEALPPLWLSPLLTSGWTGVNLFFVLSGFVLFLPVAGDAGAMASLSDRLRFYKRRALRLLPLFYLAVFVQWSLAALHAKGGFDELLAVLSFRFIIDPATFFPAFNGPLWSIGVEVAFSALFPMLVLSGRKFGMKRVAAGVLVLALGLRLLGYYRLPQADGTTFNTDMFLCRIDEFVLGMLIAQLYLARRLLPRRPGLCLLGGIVLIGAAWIGFDLTVRHSLPLLWRAGINDVLDAGFCLVMLAALAPGTRIAAALAWRPLQVLGMMCYSLYIWHWPLLNWLMPQRTAMRGGEFAVALAAYLAVTLTVACCSYRFVEFGRVRNWRALFLLAPPKLLAPAEVPRLAGS